MMILYDKLYRSGGYEAVSVKDYLSSLIDEILSTFPGVERVKVHKQIQDFLLDVNKIQPFGIIVNELVTNVMKYAFVNQKEGTLLISAAKTDGLVTLEIRDDGQGIPESLDLEAAGGFGLSLVGMLTKNLGGQMRIDRVGGTRVVLEFSV
jgi:two-component sensor histidine kinase